MKIAYVLVALLAVMVVVLLAVARPSNEKSQLYSNWSQVVTCVIAAVALVYTLWSSSQSEESLKLLEKQIQVLQASNEKMAAVEIIPLIVADAPTTRIPLGINHTEDPDEIKKNPLTPVMQPSGIVRQPFVPDTEDFLRIRNVGRGPAFQVVVVMFPEKLIIKDKEIPLGSKESHCVAYKIIPAGESVPYDHFEGELRVTEEPQCMVGKFGLYCCDADGHELAWMQEFFYTTYLSEAYATMDIASPRLYVRAAMKPNERRSLDDVTNHFRNVLKDEADENAKRQKATPAAVKP